MFCISYTYAKHIYKIYILKLQNFKICYNLFNICSEHRKYRIYHEWLPLSWDNSIPSAHFISTSFYKHRWYSTRSRPLFHGNRAVTSPNAKFAVRWPLNLHSPQLRFPEEFPSTPDLIHLFCETAFKWNLLLQSSIR